MFDVTIFLSNEVIGPVLNSLLTGLSLKISLVLTSLTMKTSYLIFIEIGGASSVYHTKIKVGIGYEMLCDANRK